MLWLLFLLFLCLPTAALSGEVELVQNGGMEGTYKDGMPAGWWKNCYGVNEAVFSEEAEDVHGGKSALKVHCLSFVGGAVQFLTPLKLKKGKHYRCSFYMRAKGDVGAVYALLRQRPAPYRKYLGRDFQPSSKWEKYSFEGICLDDEDVAGFFICFHPSAGATLWIDDVSVVESEPLSVVESGELPEGNVVPNGSFEICPWRDWRVVGAEGSLDESAAVGERSLRLDMLGKYCEVKSRLLKFATRGEEFTLSAYLRAEPPDAQVRIDLMPGVVMTGEGSRLKLQVNPTDKWKRYSISGKVRPSLNGCYFIRVLVTANEGGTVWLDGVSLRCGKGAETYSAAAAVEFSLSTGKVANIFRKGERIILRCEACNDTTKERKENLACRIVDFYGKEVALLPFEISVPAKGRASREIMCDSKGTGVFRAELIRRDGESVLTALCFSVLPPVNPTPAERSNVGGHFRLDEFHMKIASLTGIKWTRIHDASTITHWKTVESEKGNFQWFDERVAVAKRYGVEILGEFLRVPEWASSAPADVPDYQKRLYPPRDMDEYANYVRKVVDHYKDEIHYWEIWNEPYGGGFFRGTPEQYAQLAKVTARAAKEADPNCKLLAPCTCGHVPEWTERAIAAGALDGADIFSYHGYSMFTFSLYEMISKYAQAGERPLPIWNTETGITSESFYRNLDDAFVDRYTRRINPMPYGEAAALAVRYYVYALAGGAKKFFIYWCKYEEGLLPRLSAMTILEYDGSLRPFGVAYAVAASILDGSTYRERLRLSDGAEGYAFDLRGGGSACVLFGGSGERKLTVSLPAAKVLDIMGNEIGVRAQGKLTFATGRLPVYVAADCDAAKLTEALRGADAGKER